MAETLVERILRAHNPDAHVEAGTVAVFPVDMVYLQDGNTPTVRMHFERYGFDSVFDPKKIHVFFDHSVLAANTSIAGRNREAEAFAEKFGLVCHRTGQGISHMICLEEAIYQPGTLVVGADSHSCTGGARNCLALGMGASDIAAAMVTGRIWLETPATIHVRLMGTPGYAAGAKDVVLHLLARFGQAPFLGKSIEWEGHWIRALADEQKITLANLTVELGGRCCFFPEDPEVDDRQVIEIDISELTPWVACPDNPANAMALDCLPDTPINYVYMGTCTNGSAADLALAAKVLHGRQVANGMLAVVTPSSLSVLRKLISDGSYQSLLDAGVLVTPPGCGACIGTQGPIPAPGDRVFSTGSRNFGGRMGAPLANVWLGSPLVAAHTAILGRIPRLAELTGFS